MFLEYHFSVSPFRIKQIKASTVSLSFLVEEVALQFHQLCEHLMLPAVPANTVLGIEEGGHLVAKLCYPPHLWLKYQPRFLFHHRQEAAHGSHQPSLHSRLFSNHISKLAEFEKALV